MIHSSAQWIEQMIYNQMFASFFSGLEALIIYMHLSSDIPVRILIIPSEPHLCPRKMHVVSRSTWKKDQQRKIREITSEIEDYIMEIREAERFVRSIRDREPRAAWARDRQSQRS